MFPYRVGVPLSTTSGLEKWEAPDPAEWAARGYASVNIDARGAYFSEGDAYVYGSQVSLGCKAAIALSICHSDSARRKAETATTPSNGSESNHGAMDRSQ